MENNKEEKKMSGWKKAGIVCATVLGVATVYCFGKYGVKGTANMVSGQVKNIAGKFKSNKPATQEATASRPAQQNWENRDNNRTQYNNKKFNN